jgi:hypothetical protein
MCSVTNGVTNGDVGTKCSCVVNVRAWPLARRSSDTPIHVGVFFSLTLGPPTLVGAAVTSLVNSPAKSDLLPAEPEIEPESGSESESESEFESESESANSDCHSESDDDINSGGHPKSIIRLPTLDTVKRDQLSPRAAAAEGTGGCREEGSAAEQLVAKKKKARPLTPSNISESAMDMDAISEAVSGKQRHHAALPLTCLCVWCSVGWHFISHQTGA